MDELHVRDYAPSDWEALCRVHDQARLDELRLTVGVAAFRSLAETAIEEELFVGRLIVGVQAGVVAGFAAYTEAELTWLYVDPRTYRRGVGRALLRHALLDMGPEFSTVVLEGNMPALNLYLSEGFVVLERKEGRLVGHERFAAVGLVMSRKKERS
jgi:[ribosomal protein S18]-alanine N-acetyltransferase